MMVNSKKAALILIWIFIIGASAIFAGRYINDTYQIERTAPLTVEDLPEGTAYIFHPEDEAEARRLEKIPMAHYATPEAMREGGPTYGAFGRQIVAIEYELPLSNLGVRAVGQSASGQLLALPEIHALGKEIHYDHFHVG